MDINDDALRTLWQRQQPPSDLADTMARKVRRHHRLEKLRRALDVAVTIGGIALLSWPAAGGGLSPGQWLLIPFFSVFLITSWSILLRQGYDQRVAAHQPMSVYVTIRKVQLRNRLRHLRLARMASLALCGYALVSVVTCYLVATADWQQAALRLAVWAVLWALGTWWLAKKQRRATRQQYRQIARLGGK